MMNTPPSDTCTRCGLAEATCDVLLTPAFARALRVREDKFVEQGLCERCWRELFGRDPDWERYVRRRDRVAEQQMERAQALIEREAWG